MKVIEREYFYQIDREGHLFHDNSEITDLKFLNFFFRRIRPNDTGSHLEYPVISPCGQEMNFAQTQDCAIVFNDILKSENPRQKDSLIFQGQLETPFLPDNLTVSVTGVVYHPVAPQRLMGRFSSKLILQVRAMFETIEDRFAFSWRNHTYLLKQASPSQK